MAKNLAIDFGNSNTGIAYWDESRKMGVTLVIDDITTVETYQSLEGQEKSVYLVPSLINYSTQNEQWIGNQVLEKNLYGAPGTFKWMKRYISTRNPSKVNVGGRSIDHYKAGHDFLSSVILQAAEKVDLGEEEIVFTVPVESFEHYEDWIANIAEDIQITRFRLIDEASAAALGYDAHIQPNDVYIVFDFGGGTLDVSVVIIEDEDEDAAVHGKSCRVLGKSGADLGGMIVDSWIFEYIIKENGMTSSDENVRILSRALLVQCETAKKRLSQYDSANISVVNPEDGSVINAHITRDEFESQILEGNGFFNTINSTILQALMKAGEKGYTQEDIKAVLMVGGSSLIPSVQKTLINMFGNERVMLDRPLDATVRGATAFAAGVDFYDHIQHDYAIRFVDPVNCDYDYRKIIKRGTSYPSKKPVTKLKIKSSYEGQKNLGLAIYEISEHYTKSKSNELVFDPTGAARIVEISPEEENRRTYFWMNEDQPTFLIADPPAQKGEARFEVDFLIDNNKRLIINALDLKTRELVYKNYPVVKLR